ncbi:neuropeptide B-like [Mustelus asterias]
MAHLSASVLIVVTVIFYLLCGSPVCGWYKQTSRPGYYSVGRASGLLQGIRRSGYVRRGGSEEGAARDLAKILAGGWNHPRIEDWDSATMCVKEVTPQLSSCTAVSEDPLIFNCKANVHLTVDINGCDSVDQ